MYILDSKSNIPLYLQLYSEIKNQIVNELHVGDKISSIRKIAQEYGLSKNTVMSAFNQLYAEGYIESKSKSGYFVSDFNAEQLSTNNIILETTKITKDEYLYDFFPARLCQNSFPLKLWKRLFNKAINESLDFGAYQDGQGELGLREEIAKYLVRSRGVKCSSKQVIIFGGSADSMGFLARLFKNKEKIFAMEHPGYDVARRAFEDYEYKIENIGVDGNGLILHDLEKTRSKLVYITPSHQYPTGVSMPIANRLRLLQWANKNDAFIIEDDYDSEMSYKNRPIPSLQGLDNDERVIYVGTFSKSLSPALRVSYMVLPLRFLVQYKKLFDHHHARVSLSLQKTLELFMKEGHWDRHLRKIRNLNHRKHDLMKESLKIALGDTIKIIGEGGGLAILIYPTVKMDLGELMKQAEEARLKMYCAKERSGGDFEAIRMGFGGFMEDEILPAVKAFANVWFKCIKE
ncbi:MAG: PLP-dependent aminotransferase family protein [Sulfurospirillaceae bacterium]|nr:PLP-dependent aminotransferase family protein [Sulfurospirillaceae bacterium]